MRSHIHSRLLLFFFYCSLVITAIVFYAFFTYRTAFTWNGDVYFTLVDDAMISMRYARNLASGHGLVWNIGEPPIEGYTNFLWMLYMALFHLLGLSESWISLPIMVTSAIILICNIFITKKLVENIYPKSLIAPMLAVVVTAFYFPMVYWSLRGMEVGFVFLLLGSMTLIALKLSDGFTWKCTVYFVLLLIAALFTRIDTLPLIIGLIGFIAWFSIKNRKPFFLIFISITLLIFLLINVAYRSMIFGESLPNTYYLKVVGVPPIERVLHGVDMFFKFALKDVLLPFTLAITGAILFFRKLDLKFYLLLGLFLIQIIYSIYVGGDYAEYNVGGANRFITIGMPFLFIAAAITITNVLQMTHLIPASQINQVSPFSLGLVLGISFLILFGVSGSDYQFWKTNNAPMMASDIWRAKLGLLIKESTDDSTVIAVHAAGQIPYFSHRRTIDLLGKSDQVIAKSRPAAPFRPGHNKWNYEYSISTLAPDLVADEWGQSKQYLSEKTSEYRRLSNGVWIKRNSRRLINIDKLSRAYR